MSLKEDVLACNMMEEGGVDFNIQMARPKQAVTVMDADYSGVTGYYNNVMKARFFQGFPLVY